MGTQGGTTTSTGGGIDFSANVTLPTPTAPTAPTMPGALLMNLEDFVFNPVMRDNAKLESGEILTGDAGHVTIRGGWNKFIQGTSKANADSGNTHVNFIL